MAGLEYVFEPRTLAVVGATPDGRRLAGRPMKTLQPHYPGTIYPVNPRYTQVDGRTCWPSVSALPEPVDLAQICVSTERTVAVVGECASAGVRSVLIHATGFGESSAEGQRIQDEVRAICADSGMRMLGPNSVGFRNARGRTAATIAHKTWDADFPVGPVAIVGQSGGLVNYLANYPLRDRGTDVGFCVDVGNGADVTLAAALRYVASRRDLTNVGVLFEAARDGRDFLAAIEECVRAGQRVLVQKLGRSALGNAAVQSHVGAVAGSHAVFDAALAEAGATVCADERQLFEALSVDGLPPRRHRASMAVISGSGGTATLMSDICAAWDVDLPPIDFAGAGAQWQQLRDRLQYVSGTNPIDLGGTAAESPELLADIVGIASRQPGIDCVVLWAQHQLLVAETGAARLDAIRRAAAASAVPVIICGAMDRDDMMLLRQQGVSVHPFPSDAVRAVTSGAYRSPHRVAPAGRAAGSRRSVTAWPAAQALRLLAEHGVATARFATLDGGDERLPPPLEYPVCVKVSSADVVHKLKAGGIVLDIRDDRQLAAAVDSLRATFGPQAEILVQEQLESTAAPELFVGVLNDPTFGKAGAFGWGGSYVEEQEDLAFTVLPTSSTAVADRLAGLRIGRVLAERGLLGAATEAVMDVLRLGERLSSDVEIEVNPFIFTGNGHAVAVDCRVLVSKEPAS